MNSENEGRLSPSEINDIINHSVEEAGGHLTSGIGLAYNGDEAQILAVGMLSKLVWALTTGFYESSEKNITYSEYVDDVTEIVSMMAKRKTGEVNGK